MTRHTPSAHVLERRLQAAKEALAECFLHEQGLQQAATQIGQVLPGTHGFIYFRDRAGQLGPTGHNLHGRPSNRWDAFPHKPSGTQLSGALVYPVHGAYSLKGRFINTARTYEANPERFAYYQDYLLARNGVRNHLRVVFYRGLRMHAWFGVFGSRGDGEFDQHEASVFDRLLPNIRDTTRAAHLTHFGQASTTLLVSTLELLRQPVWILTRQGCVVHANASARRGGRDARLAAAHVASARDPDPRWSVSRVSLGRDVLSIVIGVVDTAERERGLPPALQKVAALVAEGLSDKEISDVCGMPLATVRTYVQRAYSRIGVKNRVALARHIVRTAPLVTREK